MANALSDWQVLTAAKLSPLLTPQLAAAFTVHDRLHDTDPAAFAAIAPKIRAVAAAGDSIVSAALIAQLPALEMISVMGVGYDGIDLAAVKARNLKVTHTPGVLDDDVADLALGLMLCAARQLPAADRFVRNGDWLKGNMPLARKMSGARLGVVGMGRIGQAIARRALAFDMRIAYTTRTPRTDVTYTYHPNAVALAEQSDYLVVITPGGSGTRHLVNAHVLAALGSKGILVNVARGSVVDEQALIEALRSKRIAGAALDVFADEPRVPQALLDLPNVVLAPHIGSATDQTRQAMADLAFNNLHAFFSGQPLLTLIPECRR